MHPHPSEAFMRCALIFGPGTGSGRASLPDRIPAEAARGSLATSLMVPWCCLSRKSKAAACLAAACLAGWLFSAPAGPDPIAFEDVASRAGVEFVLQNAATGDRRQIETMVSGVAVLDYNNDGWPDLYFVNG